MRPAPRVSVALPVRNAEAFLSQSIESVLSQTLTDIEIIAVDDGSTDSTGDILSAFESHDKRLRVHRQARSGFVNTVNAALQLCSGRYIARMDGDDIAISDRLQRQCDVLDSDQSIGAIAGSVIVIGPDARPLRTLRISETDASIRSALQKTNPFCDPAVMIRASALDKIGGYRSAFGPAADYDLWLRLSEHYGLRALRQPVLLYRWHPGQLSTRSVHVQLIGLVAARLAAQMRRANGADPFDSVDHVSVDMLRDLGLDDGQLTSELHLEAAARAAFMVAIGQPREARQLLDEFLLSSQARPAEPQVRARVNLAYARARFNEGAKGDALRWLAAAGLTDPIGVVSAAYRGAIELSTRRTRPSALPSPHVHAQSPAQRLHRSGSD